MLEKSKNHRSTGRDLSPPDTVAPYLALCRAEDQFLISNSLPYRIFKLDSKKNFRQPTVLKLDVDS